MSTTFALPGDEQYISSVNFSGELLHLRLSTDHHAGYPSSAFVVRAKGLQNVTEAMEFLTDIAERKTYIYCNWIDGRIALTTEDGEELHLTAASFEGEASPANLAEIQEALERVSKWLELERASHAHARSKLNAITALLHEQHRRIEVKAQTHPSDGTAGVLYSQQLGFIERLLHAVQGTSNNGE